MNLSRKDQRQNFFSAKPISSLAIEPLESRKLLHGGFGHGAVSLGSITFDQAPAAVQTELDTLSGTTIDTTQKVALGNSNGVETYSVRLTGTGSVTVYTVDVNGNPVTAPTKSTTTFGAISNTAVTDEFNAIATALNLTAPASTDSVSVSTPTSGPVLYTLRLTPTSGRRGVSITLDDSGNVVGNANVPFSVLSTAIQNGINALAPSGATALDPTSTQNVSVKTIDGVTTYSTTFKATGVRTTVTVDSTGAAVDLPSTSTDTFANIPSAAQTELQTLATAQGVSGTIATSQTVKDYTEINGTTTIYSVTLSAANTSGTGTHKITISVDENGNPTVPPNDGGFGGFGGCGGGGIFGGAGFGFESFARRSFGFMF